MEEYLRADVKVCEMFILSYTKDVLEDIFKYVNLYILINKYYTKSLPMFGDIDRFKALQAIFGSKAAIHANVVVVNILQTEVLYNCHKYII